MAGVEVIVEDLKTHPQCPHGPTILFSRTTNGIKRNFFACSACRDRKLCPFFLYEDERNKISEEKVEIWEMERKKFVKNINHTKLFLTFNQIGNLPESERAYCFTCCEFELKKFWEKHKDHKLMKGISNHQLTHPSEFMPPLEDSKKEAQFLFSKTSTRTIVNIFQNLGYKNVICMGTPRIHEYINNECTELESLLLDFDARYHNFYSPLKFCWYNSFNHHFFFPEAKAVFQDFISNKGTVLILDPPFGGRVEPLAYTLNLITQEYRKKTNETLPIFWVFPYFMEPQIMNSLPNFTMLDYKVDYDNHPLFQDGPKARKLGSPVRIFTNIPPSEITLSEAEGYKLCKICHKFVYRENKHCEICNSCTSKDGSTYVHCTKCQRCVKPTWRHCATCNRCAQVDHKCGTIEFSQNCFHCKKPGHKKNQCSEVNHQKLQRKRKMKHEEKLKRAKLE